MQEHRNQQATADHSCDSEYAPPQAKISTTVIQFPYWMCMAAKMADVTMTAIHVQARLFS
nr:hypothetical protein GCM10020185_80290 [Pseudomonas brassicacearum subsp. brassicacearum]